MDTEKEYAKKGRNRLAIKAKARDMSVSVFGLEKVPLEPLFKMALEEIGEQESCIEELEDKIKKMEKVNAEILKAETARWPSSWTTLTSRGRKRGNNPQSGKFAIRAFFLAPKSKKECIFATNLLVSSIK